MRITASQLASIMRCKDDRAALFVEPINITLGRYLINSPARASAFLAQIGHESGGLRYVKEIWGPTEAQKRYEGRKDLGNTQPGDGKLYMGRGLIQVTGRSNYAAVSKALGIDAINNPAVLESPMYASLSAGWFWDSRNLNAIADIGDFKLITKRINGGYNGLADRLDRFERAKSLLA